MTRQEKIVIFVKRKPAQFSVQFAFCECFLNQIWTFFSISLIEINNSNMFKDKTNDSMSAPKMSYFSDIDLATLHRSRLNERIQYKLSWFNRRQKYYIPTARNNANHRDNATTASSPPSPSPPPSLHSSPPSPSPSPSQSHTIKTYANHKFSVNRHKKTPLCQPINGLNGEMTASHSIHDSSNTKITTNQTNFNNQKMPSPINNFVQPHTNGRVDLTKDERYAQTNKHKIVVKRVPDTVTTSDNPIKTTTPCQVNSSEYETQPVINSSSQISVKSYDPIVRKTVIDRVAQAKHLPGDVIGGNACDMVHTKAVPANEEAALEEDLNLPHRKRSGTWP